MDEKQFKVLFKQALEDLSINSYFNITAQSGELVIELIHQDTIITETTIDLEKLEVKLDDERL